MKQLSRKRLIKQARQAIGKNWRDVYSYGRFIDSVAQKCDCDDGPCDSCLAGGICENIRFGTLQAQHIFE